MKAICRDTHEMRVLTDAEVAIVAGGNEPGVNEVVNWGDIDCVTTDCTYAQTTGYVIADYNHDNVYDQAWYADSQGNWFTSTDGQNWVPGDGDGPTDDIIEWENGHRPPNVEG